MSFETDGGICEFRPLGGNLSPEPSTCVNISNLEIRTRLTNFTGKTLYLKTQHNVPFVVEPEQNILTPREKLDHLKIEIAYTINDVSSAKKTLSIIDAFVSNNLHCSQEAAIVRSQIHENYFNRSRYETASMKMTIVLSRTISLASITDAKLGFIPEISAIVTVNQAMIAIPHPYSPEGIENIHFSKVLENHGQTGVMVKVIDNDQLAKYRYYYSAKRLVRVESIQDHRRESGVYVTTTGVNETRRVQFMSFLEAEDNVGLYKSQEEAITHGDPSRIAEIEESKLKIKEKELNRQLLAEKANTAKIKEDYERVSAALSNATLVNKANLEALAAERKERNEQNSEARKDYYEERSYERKDSSEAFKLIPVAIGVVVGVAGFFFGRR